MKKHFNLWFAVLVIAFVGATAPEASEEGVGCCVDSVGDVNLDGDVDLDDWHMLNEWLAPWMAYDHDICMDAADWDGNGRINEADADALSNWLDGGGPRPACHSYSACNTVINTQPVDTTLTGGDPLIIGIDASSDCPMHFRWYRNDTLVAWVWDSLLYLEWTEPKDMGVYYCRILTVNDEVVTDSFNVVTVTCEFDPAWFDVCHPDSTDVTITKDGSVTLDVTSNDPTVATFTGDQTGGTVNVVGLGTTRIVGKYNGRVCGYMDVRYAEFSAPTSPVPVCLGGAVEEVYVTVNGGDTGPWPPWTITSSNPTVVSATKGWATVELTGVSLGTSTIDLFVSDDTVSCFSFPVSVVDITVGIDTVFLASGGFEVVEVTTDPPGTAFTVSSSNTNVVTAAAVGSTVELTGGFVLGTATIDIIAEGAQTSCASFVVSIVDVSVIGPDPDTLCIDSMSVVEIYTQPASQWINVTAESSDAGVATATVTSDTTVDVSGFAEGSATIYLIHGGDTLTSFTVVVEFCTGCLHVGGLRICGDEFTTLAPDVFRVSGHANIDSVLWFEHDITVHRSAGWLTGYGKIAILNIPVSGGGTDTYILWDGAIAATVVGSTLSDFDDPALSTLEVGMLSTEIHDIELIPHGIRITGNIVFPWILNWLKVPVSTLTLTTTDGLRIAGSIDIAEELGIKGIFIKDMSFTYDFMGNDFSGSLEMGIKDLVEFRNGSATIQNGVLNSISFWIDAGYPIPFAATNLFLAEGGGGVHHISDWEPIHIWATVDISGGPQVAGNDLVEFDDVGVIFNPPYHMEVSGTFLVFGKQVAHASAEYVPDQFSLRFYINMLDIVKASFYGSLGTTLSGSARGSIGLPCDLPWYLAAFECMKFGSVELTLYNSTVKGRMSIRIYPPWPFKPFDLESAFKVAYTSDGLHFYIGTNYNTLVKIFRRSNIAGHYSEGFVLPEHSENVLFMVKGENGPAPSFQLIRPDSSVVDSTEVGLVRMDEDSIAFFVIENPEAGLWAVDIPEDGGQSVDIAVLAENTRPAIAFDNPSGTSTDGSISWHDHDPDNDAQINLYFDNDNKDFDGTLINSIPISEDDVTDAYTWDVLGVDPGDYYIYGVITDTNNAPYRVYAPGKINIPNTLGPTAPSALIPTPTDSSIQLSWPASPDDVWGYEILYSDDTATTSYDNHWTVGDTLETEILGLATGRYYKLAIKCFDSLNNISDIGATTIVMLENTSSNDPPVINPAGIPMIIQEDDLYTFTLHADDADGDPITFVLDSFPTGFNLVTDVVTWTPDNSQIGVHWIQIRATDGVGGEDTLGYILHVIEDELSTGSVQWGSPVYGGTDDPGYILLKDCDLDLSESEIDSVQLTVTSNSDPGGTQVWLKQISPSSVDFVGTVMFDAVSGGPGVLLVSADDTITVEYSDADPVQVVSDFALWKWSLTSCCIGITGNIDSDPEDMVDLGDLTKLIDYLFISFEEPECMEEANVDGSVDGIVDLSDLTKLIDYLFISFTPPAECL